MAQRNQKSNSRVTVDIPPVDHKKLKMLAAYYGRSMREILANIVHSGIEEYKDCPLDHTPNAITLKSMENIEAGIGLEEIDNVEAFFKKLTGK
jgi:hypothetical protein